MTGSPNPWPKEREDALIALWAQALTPRQIADILGGDITRNAVIGKAHRLDLPMTGEDGRRVTKAARAAVEPDAAAIDLSDAEMPVPPNPKHGELVSCPQVHGVTNAVMALTGNVASDIGAAQCRYAIGAPSDPTFHFCGSPRLRGRSYCAEHHVLVYEPKHQRYRPKWSSKYTPRNSMENAF